VVVITLTRFGRNWECIDWQYDKDGRCISVTSIHYSECYSTKKVRLSCHKCNTVEMVKISCISLCQA